MHPEHYHRGAVLLAGNSSETRLSRGPVGKTQKDVIRLVFFPRQAGAFPVEVEVILEILFNPSSLGIGEIS